LLDYYYVLLSEDSAAEREKAIKTIKYLGMGKFAKGIMYIMDKVFGLDKEKLLCEEDEKSGEFLMNEILIGGNFGSYDTRLGSKENESKWHRYWRMNLRNLRYISTYPVEALCEPLFRTNFAIWKKLHHF
jgi:hypothetical protein